MFSNHIRNLSYISLISLRVWSLFAPSPLNHHRTSHFFATPNSKIRPIDIHFDSERINFKSRVYRFAKSSLSVNVIVDLYTILHVGENAYFREVENQLNSYDYVLYELITSINNTEIVFGEFRRLNTEICAMKTERLASVFNFKTQLDMNLSRNNWFERFINIF